MRPLQPDDARARPRYETIVLAAAPPSDSPGGGQAADVRAGQRPPVRIFVGTEPSQYRAERVFLWSIEQTRDPARVYEIHLMKGLPGFRNWLWNTGFTNYRFAVPELAGGVGRAIYNDVDQIYLADPAELFDLDLDDHAFLSVSRTDTSVMLMDCEKMSRPWTLAGARRRRKYALIKAATEHPDNCGQLPPEWNARDEEHVAGRSNLLHYTTIHKQPWRPFPERFYYQPNPAADLWFERERAANAAGYRVQAVCAGPAATSRAILETLPDHVVRDACERSAARTLLEIVPGASGLQPVSDATSPGVECDRIGLDARTPGIYDGVACRVRLDSLSDDVVPEVVDALFARARRFVLATVACPAPPRRRWLHSPAGTIHQPEWWRWIFETAAARYPEIHWRVAVTRCDRENRPLEFIHGGAFLGSIPRVWVLADHKPGHTTQSEGLARELGWPYERIDLEFNSFAELPNAWIRGTRRSVAPASAGRLAPPWPDLVIATGRRTAPVAAWIRKQTQGLARTVQMGRIGAFQRDVFDLAVAPSYAHLYPDPRRIDTAAPVTRVSATILQRAGARWGPEFAAAPGPRIALLVGGKDPEHEFRSGQARRLGEAVAELALREGGSVLATTSRRTSRRVAAALEKSLGSTCAHFHRWQPNLPASENPYMGYLALADALVVTGDSASMLAEACATGKPVYIYPLNERPPGPKNWLLRAERWVADLVTARAYARPVNRRGRERPQRGLELLCAKLLAHGFVRTSGHSRRLHEELVERGLARFFDGKLAPTPSDHLTDVALVARRVRELIGVEDASQPRVDLDRVPETSD